MGLGQPLKNGKSWNRGLIPSHVDDLNSPRLRHASSQDKPGQEMERFTNQNGDLMGFYGDFMVILISNSILESRPFTMGGQIL